MIADETEKWGRVIPHRQHQGELVPEFTVHRFAFRLSVPAT
jgi:hypothetical protein